MKLATAFQFKVSFGSAPQDVDASFQEVSGIGPELETESLQEGGENRFVHQLPKAMKHPRLTLRRGIAPFNSPLLAWCRKTLEAGLTQAIEPKLLHVMLLDAENNALHSWSFANAYPVSWSVEGFESTKNELAVEKIEIAYAFSKREK